MTRERVFAPGSWNVAMARRNVAASWGALTFIVLPVLGISLRQLGTGAGLVIGAATVVVAVPATLLWVRLGVKPMRVVVTDHAVELRRRTRMRRRLLRDGRLRAVTFQGQGAGQNVGPMQLVISDGRTAIRLLDGRWVDQHLPILDALGIRADEVDQGAAIRAFPYAFRWIERHAVLFAFLFVLGLIVLIVLVILVVALVSMPPR